jgi:hypothetical protein
VSVTGIEPSSPVPRLLRPRPPTPKADLRGSLALAKSGNLRCHGRGLGTSRVYQASTFLHFEYFSFT